MAADLEAEVISSRAGSRARMTSNGARGHDGSSAPIPPPYPPPQAGEGREGEARLCSNAADNPRLARQMDRRETHGCGKDQSKRWSCSRSFLLSPPYASSSGFPPARPPLIIL